MEAYPEPRGQILKLWSPRFSHCIYNIILELWGLILNSQRLILEA
jgi:hypothetical protein